MTWISILALAPLIVALGLFLDWARCLLRNYLTALPLGIPIVIVPISPFNPFWMLVERRVLKILRRLPGFLGDNNLTRYNFRGWDIEDRCRTHDELGDVYIKVSPALNALQVNDPEAVVSVFRRGADFTRPVFVNEVLGVFGPNISTAEGASWKTQRRVATRCFNEANNEIVWSETMGLAQDMVQYWSSNPIAGTNGRITSTAHDVRTLALNVLASAGFGQPAKFQGQNEGSPSVGSSRSSTMSYRESLALILENCIVILALGTKTLAYLARSWPFWIPDHLRTINHAVESFQTYMTRVYEEEKKTLAAAVEGKDVTSGKSNNTLMALLVRASQEANAAPTASKDEYRGLTESEIYGNLFTFNFAGHDTTAHSFTMSLYFLAANPGVQDWLAEEIEAVLGSKENRGKEARELDYRANYPRFKRCLAVLYETLRLYVVVPAIKWTSDKPVDLTVRCGADGAAERKTIRLPPKTLVNPSYAALHTDPRTWGEDGLEWRPQRWIVPKKKKVAADGTGREGEGEGEEEEEKEKGGIEGEDLDTEKSRRGTFLGWSEGTRDCPGKKFSQVEFVAVMVVLFRGWRVEPALQEKEGGGKGRKETLEEARRRVLDVIRRDTGWVLLLQMLHPERTPLVWRRV